MTVIVGVREDVEEELGVFVGLDEGQRIFSQTYGYGEIHAESAIFVELLCAFALTQEPLPLGSPVLQYVCPVDESMNVFV